MIKSLSSKCHSRYFGFCTVIRYVHTCLCTTMDFCRVEGASPAQIIHPQAQINVTLFGFISVPLSPPGIRSQREQRNDFTKHGAGCKETENLETSLLKHPDIVQQLSSSGEDVDDGFLLRWLRARGSVDAALESIISHTLWRSAFLGGNVTEGSIQSELAAEKVFLQANSNGFPVVLVKAARHDMGVRALDETKRLICYVLDNSLAAADLELNPTGQIMCLFDLSGIRPRNLDAKALLAVFELLQSHYPERLYRLYFINAPFIFWGIWRVVSPFVHENTRKKIVFVSGSAGKVQLHSEIGDVLPMELGGAAPLTLIQDAVRHNASVSTSKPCRSLRGNSVEDNKTGAHGVQRIAQAGVGAARRAAGAAGRAVGGFAQHKVLKPLGGAATGVVRAVTKGHHQHQQHGAKGGQGGGLLERVVFTQFLLLGILLRVLRGAWEKTREKTFAIAASPPASPIKAQQQINRKVLDKEEVMDNNHTFIPDAPSSVLLQH